jgi:hypothetical protein
VYVCVRLRLNVAVRNVLRALRQRGPVCLQSLSVSPSACGPYPPVCACTPGEEDLRLVVVSVVGARLARHNAAHMHIQARHGYSVCVCE